MVLTNDVLDYEPNERTEVKETTENQITKRTQWEKEARTSWKLLKII